MKPTALTAAPSSPAPSSPALNSPAPSILAFRTGARLPAVLATLLLALAAPGEPAVAEADPADYGRQPAIAEVAISPDGRHLAMIESRDDSAIVTFYDVAGKERPRAVGLGANAKARDLIWGSNRHVLLLISAFETVRTTDGMREYEVFRYFSIDATSGKSTMMFSGNPAFRNWIGSGRLVHRLPDDANHVLFEKMSPDTRGERQETGRRLAKGPVGGLALYRVDLRNGRARQIAPGVYDTAYWVVDTEGEAALRVDRSEERETRTVNRMRGKRAKELVTVPEPLGAYAPFSILALEAGGDTALAYSSDDEGRRGVHRMDLRDGSLIEPVIDDPLYDVGSGVYDYDTAELIGASVQREATDVTYLAAPFSAVSGQLRKALDSIGVTLVSYSRDRSRWVVRALFADRPAAFYLFDSERKELSALGSTYPWLEDVATVREEYDYESADGLTIHGYLTTPAGGPSDGLPLVVLPHGGPAARDDLAFDWWAAFYAARGYAVYQPNFRGSTGYGFAFEDAGRGHWGDLMQDDVAEGVARLVADGIADRGRICIVGASYGGYAALAGAALRPDAYACAIAVNGVTDLIWLLGERSRVDAAEAVRYWERQFGGDRYRDVETLRALSPVNMAGRIEAPVLLIHGREDTVVPFGQADEMHAALKKAGNDSRLVALDGEDHWLSRSSTRTRMLEESIRFLDRHIGASP